MHEPKENMDILALGYYKVKDWPLKPQELIDLENILSNPAERKARKLDMIDIYKIKDRIMEAPETIQYLEELSKTKAANFGNYDYLLNLKKEHYSIPTKENNIDLYNKIEEMLSKFRNVYFSKEIKNLPVSRIIQEDYDQNVKHHNTEQNNLIEKTKKIFQVEE